MLLKIGLKRFRKREGFCLFTTKGVAPSGLVLSPFFPVSDR